jgi:hypothetical protein
LKKLIRARDFSLAYKSDAEADGWVAVGERQPRRPSFDAIFSDVYH